MEDIEEREAQEMLVEPRIIVLNNGQAAVLRSPGAEDAKAVLECIRKTSEETHFMARYPEEIMLTEEEEVAYLTNIRKDQDNFMLSAFIGGELVGNASVSRVYGFSAGRGHSQSL